MGLIDSSAFRWLLQAKVRISRHEMTVRGHSRTSKYSIDVLDDNGRPASRLDVPPELL